MLNVRQSGQAQCISGRVISAPQDATELVNNADLVTFLDLDLQGWELAVNLMHGGVILNARD